MKAALKVQLDRCVAATVPAPPDCPQYAIALDTLNLSWRFDRDPLADASVTFDSTRSLFKVTGTFAMTATYDFQHQYEAVKHDSQARTGTYSAVFFWDGSKPVFVTFEQPS